MRPSRRADGSLYKLIAPLVGAWSPAMMERSVLLPQPLGPTSATNSPVSRCRFTPSSTSRLCLSDWKRIMTSRTVSKGDAPTVAGGVFGVVRASEASPVLSTWSVAIGRTSQLSGLAWPEHKEAEGTVGHEKR